MSSTDASHYFNRELSWLEFNRRVLAEAQDPKIPLIERLRFLAITGSNLDEFFMVRVGGLQQLAEDPAARPDTSGMTPRQQLAAIGDCVHRINLDQYKTYLEELEPGLAAAGLRRVRIRELSETQAEILEAIFHEEIYPIFTPMAVSEGEAFPLLVSLTLNLCVQLAANDPDEGPRFAIIPFGNSAHRFVPLPAQGTHAYVLLEDLVEMFIHTYFPGEEVVAVAPFRLTRNADFSIREDLAFDLLAEMQQVLDQRRQSFCVRLQISDQFTTRMRRFLQSALNVDDRDIYAIPGPLDLSALMQLTELPGLEKLSYERWSAVPAFQVDPARSMFDNISEGDLLLYHPYESFEPVVRFIDEAANDPYVVAIKQTLYRTSRDSPIVNALRRAAEAGKNVTVIVELKARFDERRNIEWAHALEHAGVQVIYGVKGLKTHAKICIVVRREPQGFRRYIHFGTGNYNEATARFYSDASLLTCNDDLGDDAISFFNAITGYSQPLQYSQIEAAPISLRTRVLEMIDIERKRCQAGHKARIMAKLNSLVDRQVIDALYKASKEGVEIQLNIRGICCLRPGVPGLSENISVVSVVDRFLEHARLLYFYHGGDQRVFISSADWMPRNLDRRVELLVPVHDPGARQRLTAILETAFSDTCKAHRLQSDGSYERVRPTDGEPVFRSQEFLYEEARKIAADASRPVMFEPHRAPRAD